MLWKRDQDGIGRLRFSVFVIDRSHLRSLPSFCGCGMDYALLIGAKPRGAGMKRKDLLLDNGKIFVDQGKALNEVAKRSAKMIVVGNSCNTNCLIAMTHAPNLKRENFFAMTRVDQNWATFFISTEKSNPHSRHF
jgi:malate/lactate dehydrogenase